MAIVVLTFATVSMPGAAADHVPPLSAPQNVIVGFAASTPGHAQGDSANAATCNVQSQRAPAIGFRSAIVCWQAPANTGHLPLIAYEILRVTTLGLTTTLETFTVSASATQLVDRFPGSGQNCYSVRGQNSDGFGPSSGQACVEIGASTLSGASFKAIAADVVADAKDGSLNQDPVDYGGATEDSFYVRAGEHTLRGRGDNDAKGELTLDGRNIFAARGTKDSDGDPCSEVFLKVAQTPETAVDPVCPLTPTAQSNVENVPLAIVNDAKNSPTGEPRNWGGATSGSATVTAGQLGSVTYTTDADARNQVSRNGANVVTANLNSRADGDDCPELWITTGSNPEPEHNINPDDTVKPDTGGNPSSSCSAP